MLDTLRHGAQSWVAKLLLIVLVVAFGVWGISGTMFQGAGDTVVKVGSTEVNIPDFRFAYSRQLSLFSRQLGRAITPDQAKAMGLEAQTIAVVASSATLDEQSRRMNLGLSENRLASIIEEDPAFQGVNGRFDRNLFSRVLYNSRITEDQFISIQQDAAVRSQIIDAVVDGYEAPNTLLDAFNRYQNETRTIDYLVLGRDLVTDIADPTDEELKTYFETNKVRYRAPEYRKITYVTLRASDIADPQSISEQTARDEYARTIDRYTSPEQRTIEQLSFDTRDDAQAAAKKLEEGATFEQLVADAGKTEEDVTLGTYARDAVPDPAIAEAAFAIQTAGGTSGVVDGTFGPVIIRVPAIVPASVRSFEDVEGEIRQEMAMVEAGNILLDVHDAYEDARAGGATLAEAATKEKMSPVVIEAVDRTGRTPDGELLTDLPESSTLLQQAFDTDENVDSPPINLPSEGFLWFVVNAITPSRDRTLDEVRDKVIADWKREKTDAELAKVADAYKKRIESGEELAAIGMELGLAPDTKYDVKRTDQDAVFGTVAIDAAFSGPDGLVAVADDPGKSAKILLKVTNVTTPGADLSDLPPQVKSSISNAMANDVLGQAVRQMQTEFGVSVNTRLVEMAVSQSY